MLDRMTTLPQRPAAELRALAGALESVVGLGMRRPSEAELACIAGLIGIKVRTDSRARVAQRQVAPVRVNAARATAGARS
jgi:hypothetical protein